MFLQVELTRVVTLPPVHFGPDLKNELKRKLIDEVEGKLLGNYGYVVFVVDLDDKDIGLGRIDEDTGFADFHVKFNAIFLRPFKQEVLDARVSVVNEHGFFAEVGPLTIFVSRYNMADDMFDGYKKEEERWESKDGEVVLNEGCGVRLRILTVTTQATEITVVGTMKEDFLGVIMSAEEMQPM